MAASFFTRTKKTRGQVTLFVRLQSVKKSINHKAATPLRVDIQAWNNSKKGPVQLENFRRAHPDLVRKMDDIKLALDSTLSLPVGISQQEFTGIIDDVVYHETRNALTIYANPQRGSSLNRFITLYLEQIGSGVRQTDRGRNFARSTVRTIRYSTRQFQLFQASAAREYDFQDIDMGFYYEYTSYLKKKGYSINSVGKCVRDLKAILRAAEAEGHKTNQAWKDKRFKGTRIDVDSIYLTQDDLQRMLAVDLSGMNQEYEWARDIFMVGVWTAQRISDYNHIQREDIDTLTKNYLREIPDPEHPGQSIPVIEKKEITYVKIRQQKTGARISIPCNEALRSILEKYAYQMPHLPDQVINRCIKVVARKAQLNEKVVIETTRGGTPKKEVFEKWQLVFSHTARRTGATLMYLAGIDLYDIMKVTGHSTPAMLKKYIKADTLEVVEKLAEKYTYFR